MFGSGKEALTAGKDGRSCSEKRKEKDSGLRNGEFLDNLGEAVLCKVDLCYKQLIGRFSLTEHNRSDKLQIVEYLRATKNFEYIEIRINGGEPVWVEPYPNGYGVDYGCGLGNFTVKLVYGDENEFVTEKVPLNSRSGRERSGEG